MSGGGSLRARLLAGVLVVVGLGSVVVGIDASRRARDDAETLFDAHLAQAASVLVALLSPDEEDDDDDDERELDLEHAPELHRWARYVAFQVWERGRRLRVHSRNAPRTRLSDVERGFSDVVIDGERWRVFSTFAFDQRALVQVGERAAARDAVSREIGRHLLLPLAIALPLLGVALAFAISRALAPLRAVADEVAERDASRLEPLATLAVPREVQPLVSRLNELFQRIARSLEGERAFTADAAHELRTPLAAIRAQAEVAQASADHAERSHALAQVIAGCDRAAHLADQLLVLARLEDEAWRERFVECDLGRVARDVLAELAQPAHSRGGSLALETSGACAVRGDPALLHVLLRNLVDNALRYGSTGTVHVSVAARPSGARLEVRDEGPGLSPAERERAFDRFHRGLGHDHPGAGLGLPIAARIASLHGGTLALDDVPGGPGLRARVDIPCVRPGA